MNKYSEKRYSDLKTKQTSLLTLGEHAEMWWYESGNDIPVEKAEHQVMYSKWLDFAFAYIEKNKK